MIGPTALRLRAFFVLLPVLGRSSWKTQRYRHHGPYLLPSPTFLISPSNLLSLTLPTTVFHLPSFSGPTRTRKRALHDAPYPPSSSTHPSSLRSFFSLYPLFFHICASLFFRCPLPRSRRSLPRSFNLWRSGNLTCQPLNSRPSRSLISALDHRPPLLSLLVLFQSFLLLCLLFFSPMTCRAPPYDVYHYQCLRFTDGFLLARIFFACRHPGPEVFVLSLPGNRTYRTARSVGRALASLGLSRYHRPSSGVVFTPIHVIFSVRGVRDVRVRGC